MYMRVGRSRIDLATLTEAFKQLPRLLNLMTGLDRATGQHVNVSTYDTEEHARWLPTRSDLNAVAPASLRP
jgi:hypothetical protein